MKLISERPRQLELAVYSSEGKSAQKWTIKIGRGGPSSMQPDAKSTANITLNGTVFSIWTSGNKVGCPLISLLLNMALEVPETTKARK